MGTRRRRVGWEDESVTGSYKADKEGQFRGKEGVTFVARIMTEADEYRIHKVHDVRPPDEKGEDQSFNVNCSKEWDEEAEDYVGDCEGCEREYELQERFVCGLLILGKFRGTKAKPSKVSPDEAPHYWDFAAQQYRRMSDVALSLKRGKKKRKIHQIEVMITCEDEGFQKINITKCDSDWDPMTSRDHVESWKENGERLIEQAIKGPTKAEWTRRLKKKKQKREDDEDDEEKPRRSAKKTAKKGATRKAKKKKSEPEPDEDDDEDEGSTEDEDIDDLLSSMGLD